jgi:hypothetical protein
MTKASVSLCVFVRRFTGTNRWRESTCVLKRDNPANELLDGSLIKRLQYAQSIRQWVVSASDGGIHRRREEMPRQRDFDV